MTTGSEHGGSAKGRLIRLRYEGRCTVCAQTLERGAGAWWTPGAGLVCTDCHGSPGTPGTTQDTSPLVDENRTNQGVAGGSALREYDRRRASREERVRAQHPRIGGLLLALGGDPQSTRAWRRGAEGEQAVARSIAKLGDAVIALHDRRIPGSAANIDHLVVAPTGVYVIDAKFYRGRVVVRDRGGWFRTDLRLYVGGRDCSQLARAMDPQVNAVIDALGDLDAPVHPVLCFVEAEWPLSPPSEFDAVRLEGARSILRRLRRDGPLAAIHRQTIAARLASALPPR